MHFLSLAVSCGGRSHLEGKCLKTRGQAGGRLVTGTGLGDNGELRGRAVGILGHDRDAGDLGGLKGSGRRSSSSKAAALRLGARLPPEGNLACP